MYILVAEECRHEGLVATEVRHEAQLYLRVVGSYQPMLLVRGDEGCTYGLAQLVANGYILQVGVCRRESPCGCNSLIIRCMYMSCLFVNKLW